MRMKNLKPYRVRTIMKGLIIKWLFTKGKLSLVGKPNLVAIALLILLAYVLGEWDAVAPIVNQLMEDGPTSTVQDIN